MISTFSIRGSCYGSAPWVRVSPRLKESKGETELFRQTYAPVLRDTDGKGSNVYKGSIVIPILDLLREEIHQ